MEAAIYISLRAAGINRGPKKEYAARPRSLTAAVLGGRALGPCCATLGWTFGLWRGEWCRWRLGGRGESLNAPRCGLVADLRSWTFWILRVRLGRPRAQLSKWTRPQGQRVSASSRPFQNFEPAR
jgi:hypothetical protein